MRIDSKRLIAALALSGAVTGVLYSRALDSLIEIVAIVGYIGFVVGVLLTPGGIHGDFHRLMITMFVTNTVIYYLFFFVIGKIAGWFRRKRGIA